MPKKLLCILCGLTIVLTGCTQSKDDITSSSNEVVASSDEAEKINETELQSAQIDIISQLDTLEDYENILNLNLEMWSSVKN